MCIGEFPSDDKLAVTRGRESWNYFYLALGVVISMLVDLIALAPLAFGWKLVVSGASIVGGYAGSSSEAGSRA